MTSNSFCKHLSNGHRIYIKDGRVTWHPCCYWQGPEFDFDNIQSLRQQINVDTPWHHAECHRCKDEEQYKDLSYRQIGNRAIPVMSSQKAGWIDIQADITCNGGCLICGPWNSSYWQTELSKHGEYQLQRTTHNLRALVDAVFERLDVSELHMLQFLGGEPFLSEVDEWAIGHVGYPELCQLKYTTNGSIFPSAQRMRSWQKFREVLINFSIDGIGARFDYLRYPLKWSKVEPNIQRMIAETDHNIKFHINHTVTPLNIYFYQEFLDWVAKTFPPERLRGIHTHPAYGTMSVAATTGKVRQMVVDRYGPDHLLSKMLADNPYSDTGFTEWIEKWDQRRSLSWRTVFEAIV